MKLAYRGIDYDYNPPVLEVTNSDTVGKYRGHAVQHTYVRHVPIPQPAERLTYRGVAYQTTRTGGIQQLDISSKVRNGALAHQAGGTALAGLRSKLTGTSPAAQARIQLLKESSVQHKASIARSLQHRIDVAKAEGNTVLVQQLESEMSQTV